MYFLFQGVKWCKTQNVWVVFTHFGSMKGNGT